MAQGTELLKQKLETLLAKRYPNTICPSEVPRALSHEELSALSVASWRNLMPAIRELVWDLRDKQQVEILQKGHVLGNDVQLNDIRGPIRIRRQQADQPSQRPLRY